MIFSHQTMKSSHKSRQDDTCLQDTGDFNVSLPKQTGNSTTEIPVKHDKKLWTCSLVSTHLMFLKSKKMIMDEVNFNTSYTLYMFTSCVYL